MGRFCVIFGTLFCALWSRRRAASVKRRSEATGSEAHFWLPEKQKLLRNAILSAKRCILRINSHLVRGDTHEKASIAFSHRQATSLTPSVERSFNKCKAY